MPAAWPKKTCNIDFDLFLAPNQPDPIPQVAASSGGSSRVGGRLTATRIQEEGLQSVLAEEVATSGQTMGIIDRWRCTNDACENYHKVCWVFKQEDRHLDRFENHYPVSRDLLRMWDREISVEKSTVQEPSDNIKIALKRERQRREAERQAPRATAATAATAVIDQLKVLTELIIANSLQATLAQQQQSYQPLSQRTDPPQRRSPESPFDNHPKSTMRRFFTWWASQEEANGSELLELGGRLIDDDWDLNSLLDSSCLTQSMWADGPYYYPYGRLARLRRAIKRFKPLYKAHPDDFLEGEWVTEYNEEEEEEEE
ncbi:hypothetical protein BKA66DRAFT_285056 [Pyrenochaeta sp. MPI-SDFR-AT-0127]|nr:hypothetical protein BKA66DRAFT_285056 [Pyrenochaeta sp. MPI-SDFR-AT-0127]